jgi:neutral ceramidase
MKVGVGSVCITPDRPIMQSGFEDRLRTGKKSEGKYTDIYLKALALEDASGKRAVLVTSDLVGLDRWLTDSIKAETQKRFGLEPSELLLNSSHTHTGPIVCVYGLRKKGWKCECESGLIERLGLEIDEAYVYKVLESALKAVGESLNDLETARLFLTKGSCTLSVNRRKPLKEDPRKVTFAPNPQGPTDYDVPILKVVRDDGSVKAILFSYACHPTAIGGYLLGGDYPSFAQKFIEEEFEGAIALFLQGCGGDQKPRNVDAEGHFKFGPIEVVECFGRQLSQAVLTALTGKLTEVDGSIVTLLASVELPFQPIPKREELEAWTRVDDWHSEKGRVLLDALNKGLELPHSIDYIIQLISIGDALLFLGLTGEVCVDYSLRFKREFGENIWVLGYCYCGLSYIPSARMIPEGGYEVDPSPRSTECPMPFTPQIEEIIAEKVRELFNKLKNSLQ